MTISPSSTSPVSTKPNDFASAFAAGTKLTLDEAVEYAHATNLAPAEVE